VERAGYTLTILRKEKGRWLLARDANLLAPVQRRLAARLAKRYPEVFVHQVGVGSGPGAIRLYTPVYRNYPFDGLTETGTAGPKWWMETFIWRYDNRYAHLDSEVVTIVRLDDLKLPHVDFIKVDVQGMEKPALFGANNLLERDHPVLMVETPDDELTYWLSHLGYEAFHWVNHDLVPAVPLSERFVLNTIFVHPSHWFRLRVRR
jgi:FkbM family methyltransferase